MVVLGVVDNAAALKKCHPASALRNTLHKEKILVKKGLAVQNSFFYCYCIARISWTQINRYLFSVLISEHENLRLSPICKDKISTKKCKKLKKKGKCEDKKTWKKCMDTCKKCTPGIIDDFQP